MKSYVWNQETSHASNYIVFQIHRFQMSEVVLYYVYIMLSSTSGC
jgi:hypothetical protein